MASIAGVRAKIQGLIDKINNNVEEQSTDLTAAVDTVIDGLGVVESAIQHKAGTTEKLAFPYGYKAAVDGITGGGSAPFCVVSVKEGGDCVVETAASITASVTVTAEDYVA